MKKEILKELKRLEKVCGIKLLFAIESGSRAWKWESKDSDYDVRGVFIQDYNRVEGVRDQIEQNDGKLDIVLWDLRKFLLLMRKSNPSVWEWLSSDIIYLDHCSRRYLKKLFIKNFNIGALRKHYLSMARQNFEKYIAGLKNSNKANLKKYAYILRSVACEEWVEKSKSPPPKDYREVMQILPTRVKHFLEKIVQDKQNSESMEGRRNFEIEDYLKHQFSKEIPMYLDSFVAVDLNKIFKRYLSW